MILLPNITIDRNTLSIQEPFTLNGSLITDIDIYGSMSPFEDIRGSTIIKNEQGFCIELRLNELNYFFCSEMRNFYIDHGWYACVEGRRDITDWRGYNFDTYINEIKQQCNKIQDARWGYGYSYSNNNYINVLKYDLRRQGREIINNFRGFRDRIINNPFLLNNNINYVTIESVTRSTQKKYIHDYNYKPEYIYHYMPGEDKNTTLLLGAEIEVAGNEKEPNREDVVKKCIQIINDSEDDAENLIYSTSDSTVQIELDTMPCSLEFHKNKMNYKELFKYLDELGYKGHDCDKAGLHIHANRSYLGKSELIQQLTISKILYIIEKFNDEICVIARRNNSYSQFAGNKKNETSVIELYSKYKDKGKHVALNLKHKDSIEFRCFKSTLKYETFILTLEFVKDIIDFAKYINIEEIETMKWQDLMDTFSDELKKYYNTRLEKENKKKNENKNVQINNNSLYIGTEQYSGVYLDLNLNTIENTIRRQFESNIIQPLILNSIGSSIGRHEVQLVSSTKSEEEKLKDKIKTLKKKIKYSNNFIEKKNLEKELNKIQKELKKKIKRFKLIKNRNNTNTSSTDFNCVDF